MKTRVARIEDAQALLDIYSYYIKNTAITFEYEVPSLEAFSDRIRGTLVNYPYYVAEVDGTIAGYIYAGRFSPRAAYDWVAETSIYIHKDYHRLGLGRLLYQKIEETLKAQNITNLYAGIADPLEDKDEYLTKNSELFHAAIGYKTIAFFQKCGNKFGRWYNLIYMEKIIDEHRCPPEAFIPFSKLV
ncbi:MAG: GNAT family N-acetyltransferase [Treponemataceae bacterium]|nr:GNAT family N-acetyltransferase [Treponemataceae bacterium]